MLYELITPSDPITFHAQDDKIAYACAVLLGEGKAGCQNLSNNKSLSTMVAFMNNPIEEIEARNIINIELVLKKITAHEIERLFE